MPNLGYKQTEEHRKNIGLSRLGEKHWFFGKHLPMSARIKKSLYRGEKSNLWKDGSTNSEKLFRGSLEYRLWREAILKRDDSTCQGCGSKEEHMHVHHIKGFDEYPELRLSIDNGMVLCPACHKKLPRNRKRLLLNN